MEDIIYNTTTTKYNFFDRLKILIGGRSITQSEIQTSNEIVNIKKAISKTHVEYPAWINQLIPKPKQLGGIHPSNNKVYVD